MFISFSILFGSERQLKQFARFLLLARNTFLYQPLNTVLLSQKLPLQYHFLPQTNFAWTLPSPPDHFKWFPVFKSGQAGCFCDAVSKKVTHYLRTHDPKIRQKQQQNCQPTYELRPSIAHIYTHTIISVHRMRHLHFPFKFSRCIVAGAVAAASLWWWLVIETRSHLRFRYGIWNSDVTNLPTTFSSCAAVFESVRNCL